MSITSKKDFLTIEYNYYNFGVSRMVDKKVRLYSIEGKGKNKIEYLPPTINDIYSLNNTIPLLNKTFKTEFDFPIFETSDELKEKLKDNIVRQDEVMDTIRIRNEKFDYNCGLIKAGTGVGKSVLAIKITQYCHRNTLILVSNIKLLGELCNRFHEFTGLRPAQYGGGKKEVDVITICTKTSFSKDYKEICNKEKFETIIIDECHEGFSDLLRLAINKSFNQINLYGMSATPFTPILEQKHLEKYFGKVIDVMDGYDFTPNFEVIRYIPERVKINGQVQEKYIFEDYPELRTLLAEDEARFDQQMKKLGELYKTRKCIVILTDRIYESDHFYEKLLNGDTTKFNLIKITGATKTIDDEKQLKEAEKNGKKTIIIGSIKKIGIGFDYPPIDTIFLVSAVKWKSTVEQAIGRSMRIYKDKLNPLVVIWNDEILKGQALEKTRTIKKVYGVDKKDITFIDIGDHRLQHEKIKLNFTNIIK